jgi:hypothetical protein
MWKKSPVFQIEGSSFSCRGAGTYSKSDARHVVVFSHSHRVKVGIIGVHNRVLVSSIADIGHPDCGILLAMEECREREESAD